ncbi:uncharacterized protein [Anabrus simplex]|uniref:uncharacterized protein n=1 Tax=Anabrus simplex TaxID=316456 RepID=UPI0034DD37BB
MADAAPDKAKDKPKKKKVPSTKDKEKAGTEKTEDQSPDAPKEKKSSKKEKVKPESGEKADASQKAPATDANQKKAEGGDAVKPADVSPKEPSADGSRKASLADGSRKASVAEVDRKPSVAEPSPLPDQPEIEVEEPEIDDEKFKPSYVPPPPATKKDVDLLTDLDEAKLLELKEAFELFDLDQDGFIDSRDLMMTFQTLGQTDVKDEDVQSMLSEAICPLDFDAFVILLGYKTIEMDPEQILVEALSQWDYDNSGLISEERIKHDLMTWGDKFTKEEAEMALEDAPVYVNKKTGSAMIDYIKFCNTLSGLRKKTRAPGPEDFMKHK